MPNGGDLTREEFRSLELPLLAVDELLSRFAEEIGAQIDRNYHSSPRRDIRVDLGKGLCGAISISPVVIKMDARDPWIVGNYQYDVGVLVYKDDRGQRSVWFKEMAKLDHLSEKDQKVLLRILRRGWKALKKVKSSDLTPSPPYKRI